MILEKKFDADVWYVLQKIKKSALYGNTRKDIEYRILTPSITGERSPSPFDELGIMGKLVEWGAVKYKEPNSKLEEAEVSVSRGMNRMITVIYLEMLQPKFGEIYKEYEEKTKEISLTPLITQTPKSTPEFDIAKGDIVLDSQPCHIADSGDYQYHLCRELLIIDNPKNYKIGDWLTEQDIQDRYSALGLLMEAPFKSTRWVKDAVYKINEKVRQKFGIKKLIDYRNAQVRIIIENFNNQK